MVAAVALGVEMTDTTFNIRASADGNQYSLYPAGNYVTNSTLFADGDLVDVVFLGGGDNIAPEAQAFLGGHDGPIETASLGAVFSSFMPDGWGMPGGDGSYVRNARALNGNKTLCHDRTGGAYQFGIRFDTGAPQRTLFARYSYFFDNPNNITVGQLKQYRVCGRVDVGGGIHDGDIANILLRRFNDLAFTVQNRGIDGDPEGGGENTAIITGSNSQNNVFHLSNVWVTVEVLVTINSAPGVADGRLAWFARREDTGAICGQRVHENVEIWTHGQPYRYQVLQMWMGNGYDETCKVYIDRDVYFSWSNASLPPKFIVLGDSPTYSPTMKQTVCRFVDWQNVNGNASVRVKLNKGAHSNLVGKYMYLMTAPGVAFNSSGVPLGVPSGSTGNGSLAWTAPQGLENGKPITITSATETFEQPRKQIHLGFGSGWLYSQPDGTLFPESLTVNGEVWDQIMGSTDARFQNPVVVSLGSRKFLRVTLKPGAAEYPYGSRVLAWDAGGEITNADVAYVYKSSRLTIGTLPSNNYQWKQLRIWSTTELEGDGANEAYIPYGTNGWGRVAVSIGQSGDVGYNATVPRGVVGGGLWSSFGWAWRPNTVDQADGEMATHYKVEGTPGFIRRNPINANTHPVDPIRSDSPRRPRYMMTQDYIGNTSPGDGDFTIDVTDLYFKLGGDLFLLADSADLTTCTANPTPLVPVSFDGPARWTFNLWLGEMASFAGKYIHRLDSMLNPLQVVPLDVPNSEPAGNDGAPITISGNVVTLNGNDFPTRSRAAPLWWDNFFDAANGQSLDLRAPLVDNANGTDTWAGTYRGAGQAPYAATTGNRIAGKPSAFHPLTNENYNCSLDVRHTLPDARVPVYTSFWWECTPGGNNRQVKPFAIYGNRPGTDNQHPQFYIGMGNFESFPGTLYENPDDSLRTGMIEGGGYTLPSQTAWGPISWADVQGRFIKFEIVLIQSDQNTANGLYACKVYDPDNPAGPTTSTVIRENVITRNVGGAVWRQFAYGHYAGTVGGTMSCPVHTDDIILDDGEDHARVVLGTHAEYAQCAFVEDQPATSWVSTQIRFPINKGRFVSGQVAHVFIVTGAGHSGHGSATRVGQFVVP